MKKTEIVELLDHIFELLDTLEDRVAKLEEDYIDGPVALNPLDIALDESGYEDLEAEAFVEGYKRAEEDLAPPE